MTDPHQIVVVGGGAGGLELATRLGDRLGSRDARPGRAQVTLIDRAPTHVWKPLLHQVAAGSLDPEGHALDYLAQARWHRFRYRRGAMVGLDRRAREVGSHRSSTKTGARSCPPAASATTRWSSQSAVRSMISARPAQPNMRSHWIPSPTPSASTAG